MARKRATDWPRCPGYGGLLATTPDQHVSGGCQECSTFERGVAPHLSTSHKSEVSFVCVDSDEWVSYP